MKTKKPTLKKKPVYNECTFVSRSVTLPVMAYDGSPHEVRIRSGNENGGSFNEPQIATPSWFTRSEWEKVKKAGDQAWDLFENKWGK